MSTTGTARDLERFTIDVDQDILDDLRARLNAAAFGGDPGDAFEVIVPSLPGFGSTPLTNGKENYLSMADRFHTLMTDVLGYEKFLSAPATTAHSWPSLPGGTTTRG